MVNIAQVDQTGKGKIEEIAARNDTLSLQILLALLFAKAFNPDSGLTLRSIANAIGAHPQQVKRRINGRQTLSVAAERLSAMGERSRSERDESLALKGRHGSHYRRVGRCDIFASAPKRTL